MEKWHGNLEGRICWLIFIVYLRVLRSWCSLWPWSSPSTSFKWILCKRLHCSWWIRALRSFEWFSLLIIHPIDPQDKICFNKLSTNKILTHIKYWPAKSCEQFSVCSNISCHIHTLSKYTPSTLQTIYSKKIILTIS